MLLFPFIKRDGDKINVLSFEDIDAASAFVVVIVNEDNDADETLRLSSVGDVATELVFDERCARYFDG